ncbi:MAG TPA: Gfo/Idh/MocA family oxidoreductase [Gammaproteobacteria bacterium]|nr:Gfo/Idh/MocA family oxidoreductase [Gammaproteobacteria bacterium]
MSKLRAAVVGVGYLGRFHAQKYRALDEVELVGVCDLDAAAGGEVAQSVDAAFFPDYRELVGKVDAVTIAASTSAHFELARFFLEHGVHVLVEKPMTRTSAEAAVLTELAERRGLKLQVGHVERFNPALLSARAGLSAVSFIECHRLAPFKGRGADVNVILDLMIHDLDVILSLVAAEPTDVSAVGIAVLTDDVDIANARIEFANRAIANVTASRVSTGAQRRFRVFQANQYVAIDFGSGEVRRVTRRAGAGADQAALEEESWSLEKGDALLAETKAFVASIRNDTPCEVSGADGVAALRLAEWIGGEIAKRAGV